MGNFLENIGSFLGDTGNNVANFVSDTGKNLNAPTIFDWNTGAAQQDALTGAKGRTLSSAAGQALQNNESYRSNGNIYNAGGDVIGTYPQNISLQPISGIADVNGNVQGGSSTTGSNGYTSGDIAALQQNAQLLNSLLGRLQGGIDRGKQTIDSQYNQELSNANLARDRQLGTYGDQTTAQKTNRENQLGQINQNANAGMNSLRNIIGRSSGSGSSVYQDLLPYLIGNDMSSNRRGVMNTTGENLQSIDKAKNQYEADFSGVLQDLANQKKQNENNLMSGIEGQRQGYLQQQMTNNAQLSQAQGGGYDQVKQAIAPIQSQYDQSLNNVDSFFNQFQPTYTPNQKAAPTAALNTYTVDRSTANATDTGAADNNPYASLLRKKLTGQA
jgi:hypothetical protein